MTNIKKLDRHKARLHGSAPDTCKYTLLLIDVINDFSFPGGSRFAKTALNTAHRICKLKNFMERKKIPIIYANDNFGKWRSDRNHLVHYCLRRESKGREVTRLLKPSDEDYFVIKPKHSAFFSTTLETLLKYLEIETLIIAGFTTNQCVLASTNDAHMHDYKLIVPKDCVAALSKKDHAYACRHIQKTLGASMPLSTSLIRNFSKIP